MYYSFAFIAGALTLVSMISNANLAKYTGTKKSTFINFFMGLIFSFVLLMLFDTSQFQFINVPIWAYFGGFMGILIVLISNIIIPKIPTIYTTLLIFVGQLITGLAIDYFQQGTLPVKKITGMSFIIVGLVINFYFDKTKQKSLLKEHT